LIEQFVKKGIWKKKKDAASVGIVFCSSFYNQNLSGKMIFENFFGKHVWFGILL